MAISALPKRAVAVGFRRMATYAPEPEPEHRDVAVYPPILDMSTAAIKRRARFDYYDKMKAITRVEDKIFGLNMPRKHGWLSFAVGEALPPRSLPLIQHCTRTHLVNPQKQLPSHYLPFESAAAYQASELRPLIEAALVSENLLVRRFNFDVKKSEEFQRRQIVARAVIHQINRILVNRLSPDVPHLSEAEVDFSPRHEAFWLVGGILNHLPISLFEDESKGIQPQHDKAFQYLGDSALTLRSNLPLEPFSSEADSLNPKLDVPFFKYDPYKIGFFKNRRRATVIPGFWPGDKFEHGLLSYHVKQFDDDQWNLIPEEKLEMLHAQAILASFTWLYSQACYQGFSTYNDITYPLPTQTVITDGQYWSFYTYQLNTITVNNDHITTNPKRNICHCMEPMKLYEAIEPDGKIVGFNEDVLKILIQFYLNAPKLRENTVMKPYLDENCKYVADVEYQRRREWVEEHYKRLMANRFSNKLPYEIYLWERIYKIRFPTRPLEPRRRPFETFSPNPYLQKLNDHKPIYIPRPLQGIGIKKRVKWASVYYPRI